MLTRLIKAFSDWNRRCNTEFALRSLDDRLLDDIGLTRRRPLLLSGLEAPFLGGIDAQDPVRNEMEPLMLNQYRGDPAQLGAQIPNFVSEALAKSYRRDVPARTRPVTAA